MLYKVLVITFSASQAFALFGDWNGLYSTWTSNPFKGFDKLPREMSEIGEFKLMDNACEGDKFYGQRYWYRQDPALILLFDKNGYIAGIQTAASKSKFTPLPGAKGVVDDGYFWTATAYFVDPSTICTTGRTKEEFKKQGTGTGLWLQSGPDRVNDLINIPLNEKDIKKTLWGHGKCFVSMGQHYWYNTSADMDCNDFYPNCLLYNGGKLTAFCFALNADLESKRYDNPHPTPDDAKHFFEPVPKCFFNEPTFKILSTIHIYFHSEPRLTTWC